MDRTLNLPLFAATAFLLLSTEAARSVDFVNDVRPILEKHCYDCHTGEKHKSGFRVDVKSAAMRGGDNHGPDIIPGNSAESPFIQFLSLTEEENRMPPKGKRLSPAEIETLTKWVDEGANWPEGVDRVKLKDTTDHWSFKPLRTSPGDHTIDEFVQKKLTGNQLTLSPPADRRTWFRRVSYDLTGLPPSPEEMEAFLSDSTPNSKETIVERLLASNRYGERWAQHWLDVVRYADTHGFEVNTERAWAWPYRDYVIRSFNSDLPWDQFIRESIAGDAYGKPEATGFLVTAAALLPGQIGKDEASKRLARQDELGEIITNVGEAFLGLSIGCARCHDHKFDPVSARDYYSMQAFFAGVKYGNRPLEDKELQKTVEDLYEKLHPIEAELTSISVLALQAGQRAPLSTTANLEHFPEIETKRIRFTVLSTIRDNLREPYIDELEIYNTDGENVALTGTAKSAGSNSTSINDGVYGNKSTWKSRTKGKGEVIITLTQKERVHKIIWGRDRTGKIPDRLASQYRIEAEVSDGSWQTLATSKNRLPFDQKRIKDPLYQLEDIQPEFRKRGAGLAASRAALEKILIEKNGGHQFVFAAQSHEPEPMHLLNRGDPEQPGEIVAPASLAFLNPVALPENSRDLERRDVLAKWIADPDNPLTARVIVNRIWQWHFGTGLVSTPNDFGNLGMPPSHPELLDWLALDFIESGWSVKELHRKIVLSSTYGQSNLVHETGAKIDRDSRLLWRFPSRRIEAESIHDSILAVSGQLDFKMYGPGFNLFHSRGGTGGFKPIESHLAPEGRRRMVYAYKVRMERGGVFGAFDCPDAGQSAPNRGQSTTPIQALNLFNSSFTIDLSKDFAKEIVKRAGDDPTRQIAEAWNWTLARNPTPLEESDALLLVSKHGLASLCRALFNSNEFLFLP